MIQPVPATESSPEEPAGDVKFPLRTKRKAETRQRLVSAARSLFFAKGYDNTTLEEIAEKAGLHVQTLYRHFATKQELAMAGDRYWADRFRSAIEDPSRTDDTFTFWRKWMTETIQLLLKDGPEEYRTHIKVRWAAPQMAGAMWTVVTDYEDLLTASIAKDFQMDADGAGLPRLVAGMMISGNNYVLRLFENKDIDLLAEIITVIDRVEALFSEHIVR